MDHSTLPLAERKMGKNYVKQKTDSWISKSDSWLLDELSEHKNMAVETTSEKNWM